MGKITKCPAEETNYICEISRGVGYNACMDDIVPCLTPSCRAWVFNRWRWIIAMEMLALQGFPVEDLDLEGLTNLDIERLAGNAMSVPVIGAFMYMVLSFVHFPPDSE